MTVAIIYYNYLSNMNYFTKRDLNRKKREELYLKMYEDLMSGLSWKAMAQKYGYKNANSMSTAYYLYVVPFMKKRDAEKNKS